MTLFASLFKYFWRKNKVRVLNLYSKLSHFESLKLHLNVTLAWFNWFKAGLFQQTLF